MTETKSRKTESVEDLDAEILEMEAELADGHGRPLSWDEVTATTPDEMARKEQRRRILPRLIHAAKGRRGRRFRRSSARSWRRAARGSRT